MTRFRPLFWPTVFTVPVVLLCLGLGFWQIERLFWKRELIAAAPGGGGGGADRRAARSAGSAWPRVPPRHR